MPLPSSHLFISFVLGITSYSSAFAPPYDLKQPAPPWLAAKETCARSLYSGFNVKVEELVDDNSIALSHSLDALGQLTKDAVKYRGEEQGLQALEQLAFLCAQRRMFDFDLREKQQAESPPVISLQRQLLSSDTSQDLLRIIHEMHKKSFLSTNPDSVDGLPSLHLNLISGGTKITENDDGSMNSEFRRGIDGIVELVKEPLYEKLLPQVQTLLNSTSIRISDVFLRRYGQFERDQSRRSISAHFDVFSQVTCVIALDNTAKEGNQGLYTTASSRTADVTNHASCRRFFPLSSGDGVVHTWDILHGVDVLKGAERSSLIIWFDDDAYTEHDGVSPWLFKKNVTDEEDMSGVKPFVQASALESAHVPEEYDDEKADPLLLSAENTFGSNVLPCDDVLSPASSVAGLSHPHDLYLKSASQGNVFALSRLGGLCEQKSLSYSRVAQAVTLLDKLQHPKSELPHFLLGNVIKVDSVDFMLLAQRFWWEAAMKGGNPSAQIALGHTIMENAVESNSEDLRLLASVFFALAAQQGVEIAMESLTRAVEFELSHGNSIASQEDFDASPVVRTAQAATLAMDY